MGLFAPRIKDVETGRTPQYPDLQPLHSKLPAERVFSTVVALAGKQKRWTVVKIDPSARTLSAEARTRVWGFVDDVTIRVEEAGGESTVHVRSRSRAGKSDFGKNARRIRGFLKHLAKALKSVNGAPS